MQNRGISRYQSLVLSHRYSDTIGSVSHRCQEHQNIALKTFDQSQSINRGILWHNDVADEQYRSECNYDYDNIYSKL